MVRSFLLASNRLNPYMIKIYMFSCRYYKLYKINIQKPVAPSALSGHVISLLACLRLPTWLLLENLLFLSVVSIVILPAFKQVAAFSIDVHCFHSFIWDKFSCLLLDFSVRPHINPHLFCSTDTFRLPIIWGNLLLRLLMWLLLENHEFL